MADVDIDPFGEHDKTDSHPDDTGENIPLNAGGGVMGGSTWEPEHEHETSFGGGKTQERRLIDSYVDSLYKKLSKHYSQTWDAPIMIILGRKASGFTSKAGTSHSPIRMES